MRIISTFINIEYNTQINESWLLKRAFYWLQEVCSHIKDDCPKLYSQWKHTDDANSQNLKMRNNLWMN